MGIKSSDTVTRRYSYSEVAEMTGVSVVLLRDWRRRGILPKNKGDRRPRFSFGEVIKIAILKQFTEAGHSVSYVAKLAEAAIGPFVEWAFDTIVGGQPRYAVMIKPVGHKYPALVPLADLSSIDGHLINNRAACCSILSFDHLARSIVNFGGAPFDDDDVTLCLDEARRHARAC